MKIAIVIYLVVGFIFSMFLSSCVVSREKKSNQEKWGMRNLTVFQWVLLAFFSLVWPVYILLAAHEILIEWWDNK